MDMLQLREKEIFDTLKEIKRFKFVVIGGYAVGAYTLPRFSVDCDIVVEDSSELKNIGENLKKIGYIKKEADEVSTSYGGEFVRYEKELENSFKASIDILFKDVLDRQTNSTFSARWVFENSVLRMLKGKTITEMISLRVINPDALIAMKSTSCRIADIRDVFMLAANVKDEEWVRKEIGRRCNAGERFKKIKDKIGSKQFKDDLQGVYGYIDQKLFEKHNQHILELFEI